MNGLHFTIIGAVTTIALTYWAIHYSQGTWQVATGGTKAIANIPRVFTADPGQYVPPVG